MDTAFWMLAEVMDKQASVASVWGVALVVGACGFLLGRQKPVLSLVWLTAIILLSYRFLSDIWEPNMYRAIVSEDGLDYFWHSYLAILCALALTSGGFALGVRGKLTGR